MRQVVLDTETTGLEPRLGHRIIEIGCVELVNRKLTGRRFQQYLQPDRKIDPGAVEVHGITSEFLEDKPRFAEIVDEFTDFVRGSELIIHNAPFDIGFLNHELSLLKDGRQPIDQVCGVADTLVMARKMHPGQRNSLDALCKRYSVDNSQRDLHGALLDAEILADVYLLMTGGQVALRLDGEESDSDSNGALAIKRLADDRKPGPVLQASAEELAAHDKWLAEINESSGGRCVWLEDQ